MMTLEVFTKNYSLTTTLELPDGPVPRAGDVIGAYEGVDLSFLQGNGTLLVHEVEYALRGGRLTPIIRAHACGDVTEDRRIVLQERGWLEPRD
jgi:hypothetical protein